MTKQGREQPTARQSQYLSYIQRYTELHSMPPAEAEIAEYFQVTAPTVHQMILSLEARRYLARTPGKPRSLRILVSVAAQPDKGRPRDFTSAASAPGIGEHPVVAGALAVGRDVLQRLFVQAYECALDDAEFAPLVRCVLEGLEAGLLATGVDANATATARATLLTDAVDTYTRCCAHNDPEGANAETDQEVFLYLMKHGRWPKGQ